MEHDIQVKNKPLRNAKGQLLPGQTANPKGRPKGPTLKEWVRNKLMGMTDDERIEFLKNIPLDIQWRMAEGNPKTDSDITSDGKAINNIVYLPAKPNTDVETN